MLPKHTRSSENPDPTELNNPIPKVIIGLIIGMIAWGIIYIFMADPSGLAQLGDQRIPSTLTASDSSQSGGVVDGRQVYTATCQACHQATGQGLPGVFPPLAGASWVTGDPHILTQIVLHGLTGPVEVAGTTYNGAMPAFGAQLNDAELAAVLTFVRSEWGNSSPAVEAQTVKSARDASVKQTQPWSNVNDIQGAIGGASSPVEAS